MAARLVADLENIEFVSDQERLYFHQAKLGEDVIQWLNSPVGRYLHGVANQEIEELRDALEKCDPDSRRGKRKIRKLQLKAQAARYFMQWCTEAVQNGEAAFRQIQEEQ